MERSIHSPRTVYIENLMRTGQIQKVRSVHLMMLMDKVRKKGPKITPFRRNHKEIILRSAKAGQFLDPILGPVFGPKTGSKSGPLFERKNNWTASGIANRNIGITV